VHEASVVKFRAILMTNSAIIAGITPQVLGGSGTEYLIPIAAATMGGVAISTLFTFFTVPALFLVVEKWTGSGKQFLSNLSDRLMKENR